MRISARRKNREAPPKLCGSERLKSFFHFADKFQKLRGVRDAGMPTQVALDQIVGLLNTCTRNNIPSGIAIAAYQPQVIRYRSRSGHVVSHDDDGVQLVQAGNLVD